MIDSTSVQGNSGLATALRDKSGCTIPIQPNRSLPVRPAPHTPCRSVLSRKSSPSSSSTASGSQQNSQNSQTPEINNQMDQQAQQVKTQNVNNQISQPTLGLIRIGVPNWQSEIRLPFINIIGISHVPRGEIKIPNNRVGRKRNTFERDDQVSTSNCLIDISNSPERVETLTAQKSPSIEAEKNDTTEKKRRRRRSSKKDEERIESSNSTEVKIVPPLRLKKIQSLQESPAKYSESWGNVDKAEESKPRIPGFRFYQPPTPEPESPEEMKLSKDCSLKYQIIPPKISNCDSSTSKSSPKSSEKHKNSEKGNCNQKYKTQLRELKKKADELHRKLLKDADSGGSLQEMIKSYEEQIEKVKNLMKKPPDLKINDACSHNDAFKSPDVTSTNPGIFQMDSSNSPTSPEPPKLSPRYLTNYDVSRNISEVRNSPPLLPKATVDEVELTWSESKDFEGLQCHVELHRSSTKGTLKELETEQEISSIASPIITTTAGTLETEEIDLDRKPELLDPSHSEIPNDELKDMKNIEISNICDSRQLKDLEEVLKNDLDRSASPGQMVIDTSSVLSEFEARTNPEESSIKSPIKIVHCTGNGEAMRLSDSLSAVSPIISSSCEVQGLQKKQIVHRKSNHTKEIMIGDQFPSLGSWYARIGDKLTYQGAQGTPDNKIIQGEIPADVRMVGFQEAANRQIDNAIVGMENRRNVEQWRDHRWQAQEQRQQQPVLTNLINQNASVPRGNIPVAQRQIQQQQEQQQKQQQQYAQNQHHVQQQQQQHQHQQQVQQPQHQLQQQMQQPQHQLQQQMQQPQHQLQQQAQKPHQQHQVQQQQQTQQVQQQLQAQSPQQQQPQQQHQQMPQVGPEFNMPSMPMGRLYPRKYTMDSYGGSYPFHPAMTAAVSLWGSPYLQYPFLRPQGVPNPQQISRLSNSRQYQIPQGRIPMNPPMPQAPSGHSSYRSPAAVPQVPQDPKRPTGIIGNHHTNVPQTFDHVSLTARADYPQLPAQSAPLNTSNQSLQQNPQAQQSQQHFNRIYGDSGLRGPTSEVLNQQLAYQQAWKGTNLPPQSLGNQNYRLNTNWTSDPRNLLATLSPAALQAFPAPVQVVPRSKNSKEHSEQRNCETPHLGEVNYGSNTSGTLQCSHCSSPGPLFKCLGCEIAFYCDESCQVRHWNRHVLSCPKIMPRLRKVVP